MEQNTENLSNIPVTESSESDPAPSKDDVDAQEAHKGSINLKDIDLGGLQEKCPAFKEGCPFSGKDSISENKDGVEQDKSECLFKDAKNLTDVHAKITELDSSPEGRKELGQLLGHIHSVSSQLKESVGECPVFQSDKGCPFKILCSDGIPLLEKFAGLEWLEVLKASQKTTTDKAAAKESDIDLSKELKLGTKKVHRAAENVHFIREFMRGRVEQKIYLHFVASLYYVYRVLEKEGEKHKEDPLFKNIYFPKELNRVETLKEDLTYFYGSDWEDEIRISPATQNYIDRIEEISATHPKLLISQHYTRYLGDLSGGQVLKKVARKTYSLPENGDGVRFYEFKEISDVTAFKNAYRQKLDDIDIDRDAADELVEEAKTAFMLNIGLFKELDELSGFSEEIEHTKNSIDSKSKVEEISKTEEIPKMQTKMQEGDDNQVNWIWIVAVAALIFAILMGVFTKVVT